jgi:hypothetical protein
VRNGHLGQPKRGAARRARRTPLARVANPAAAWSGAQVRTRGSKGADKTRSERRGWGARRAGARSERRGMGCTAGEARKQRREAE